MFSGVGPMPRSRVCAWPAVVLVVLQSIASDLAIILILDNQSGYGKVIRESQAVLALRSPIMRPLVTSSIGQRLGWLVILLAVVLGTTVAASANSQSFQETVKGPQGSQVVTVDYHATLMGFAYTVTLSGASGSFSGTCGLFSKCSMQGSFQGIGSLANFKETVSGSWSLLSGKGAAFSLAYSSPEESSMVQLLCILGLFALAIGRYSMRNSVRARF